MGPNLAEREADGISRRAFVGRVLGVATGIGAVSAVGVDRLLQGAQAAPLIPNPDMSKAAEAVGVPGVEILGSVASSFESVAFIYKAEDGKNYAAIAGLKDGKVEATRLLTPIDPQSIGTSKDGKTVAVGGSKGEVIKSTDGGATWKKFSLPPEYDFVTEVVPVETVDQNPNRPVAVIAYNVNTGNPTLIMIYPDGAVLPVTNSSISNFTSSIREEEAGKYVSFGVDPTADYAIRKVISRTGNSVTVEENKVFFASGVVAYAGESEVFKDGQRRLLVPRRVGTEGGFYTNPFKDTESFMADKASFPEIANDAYGYGTTIKGVEKQGDSNWVYTLIEVSYRDTSTAPIKKFTALIRFDIDDPDNKQRIPIKIPDDMQGLDYKHPMIIKSGTDQRFVVVGRVPSTGEERLLLSSFDDRGMTFGVLPDVKALQAPATKVFVPSLLNTLQN